MCNKNQTHSKKLCPRSSLDEIAKRSLSPDPHLISILKRKSSREDSCEERLSPEPQGILKRKHGSYGGASSDSGFRDFHDVWEVRPILKKKQQSREESSSSDSLSLEPRPILKKKSSTDSDEHDDKPKKTILKCSRKGSQDEGQKLDQRKQMSSLRYRLSHISVNSHESDCIRPILKQSNCCDHVSRSQPNFGVSGDNGEAFSRKRAQSMGHVYISTSRDDAPEKEQRTLDNKLPSSRR